ncbi:beta-galactosidase [Pseudarcicella hirudinis]|uniref:Beta-galactosidase n=1 Tax=Pseudarcicella hirudinis TaxID=1079859 RepID=A0A1I5VEU5_9BACT|nr:beta-galactosidase family protein [Pseudarcicella hirudinis]SFQ06005.1 beta-galactosidase [Pseudarcicella hirudinis]
MKKYIFLFLFLGLHSVIFAQRPHKFELSKDQFLLDGKPFQIISAEMHPARIPVQYWRHRIKMAKALGCNTIAAYVFWNYHEEQPGKFDFSTENHNITGFIKMAQEEGMWVLLRPGPYVCAEWDFGGLPAWLLKTPDIKLRCMDPVYMQAVTKYVQKLSSLMAPLQVSKGGPILMVQVENEYGSYGNDKKYLETLRKLWLTNGINVPFYTADGPTPFMLEAGSVEGAAIGLDSGSSERDFEEAGKQNPNVPSFSSETYPGWLTHWGEKWARPDTTGLLKEIKFLLDTKRSVNLYVAHGGTNFGYWAGANAFKPTEYQPDITSYDYDAPIAENGTPKPKYFAIRKLISQYVKNIPELPAPIPSIEIPSFKLIPGASLWENLPKALYAPQPKPMEAYGQNSGFMLYRTKLIGHKSGSLTITEPHDYATVFLNGKYVGSIYRDGGNWTIPLPKSEVKDPVLEIFVEGMGHINFAQYMIDRKGITDRVTLNGMTLMNWETFLLPFDSAYLTQLKPLAKTTEKPGIFFKGSFDLPETGDTYLDMSNWKKGIVWVNGRNLGRYWEKGPQKRLYCPGVWLKKGKNEVVVFDLHQTEGNQVSGFKSIE